MATEHRWAISLRLWRDLERQDAGLKRCSMTGRAGPDRRTAGSAAGLQSGIPASRSRRRSNWACQSASPPGTRRPAGHPGALGRGRTAVGRDAAGGPAPLCELEAHRYAFRAISTSRRTLRTSPEPRAQGSPPGARAADLAREAKVLCRRSTELRARANRGPPSTLSVLVPHARPA